MQSIYINPLTNDIEFDGSNNLKIVEDDEELIQSVWMIVSTNVGEWFLNKKHGFNRSVVLRKQVEYEQAVEELYSAVLQDDRVRTVEDIQFDFDAATRKLVINFAFTKQNGELVRGAFSA